MVLLNESACFPMGCRVYLSSIICLSACRLVYYSHLQVLALCLSTSTHGINLGVKMNQPRRPLRTCAVLVIARAAMSKPVPAVPLAAAVPVAAGVPLSGPPGAPLGGVYTFEKHCGLITILIALFVFPCVCCCPCDTQEVYVAPDGTRWTRTGARLSDGKRCCCFL